MAKEIKWTGARQELVVPKAPKFATHAKLEVLYKGKTLKAETDVKNFGVAFRGVAGRVIWGRYPRGQRALKFESMGPPFEWDGFKMVSSGGATP